jgi:type IV pilus assembly protein PilP
MMKLRIQIDKALKILFCVLFAIFQSGCTSTDTTGLENELSEIMSRPGGLIEPLPEIKPYEAYTYQSGLNGANNPFKLFYVIKKTELGKDGIDDALTPEVEREIKNRNREELEAYELDSLRMVGTLDDDDDEWGIVLDPDGAVHRVSVGNYLGINIGKITHVYEDRIELREIIQNSDGRWEERKAALALIEIE